MRKMNGIPMDSSWVVEENHFQKLQYTHLQIKFNIIFINFNLGLNKM